MVYIKNKEQNRFKKKCYNYECLCCVSMEILIMMVQKYQAEKKSEMRNDKTFSSALTSTNNTQIKINKEVKKQSCLLFMFVCLVFLVFHLTFFITSSSGAPPAPYF